MAYLTSKARRFVDLAMQMPENARYADRWAAWQERNANQTHPTELTPEASRMVALALRELEKSLLRRIEEAGADEDAVADFENDLSFIEAVQRGMTESRVAL